MGDLLGSWIYLVLHIVNLAALVFLLKLILYKPMKKFMDQRREELNKEITLLDDAAAKAEGARSLLEQKEKELEKKQNKDYYEAMQKANASADELLKGAQRDADEIVAQANAKAEEIQKNAHMQIQETAAAMAVDIVAAILPEKLSESEHQALIDAGIAEAKKHG